MGENDGDGDVGDGGTSANVIRVDGLLGAAADDDEDDIFRKYYLILAVKGRESLILLHSN